MRLRSTKPVLLVCISLLLTTTLGCPMYTAVAFKYAQEGGGDLTSGAALGADPRPIASDSTQVILAWDPPPSAVTTYRLLFRIHGTNEWYSLAQMPADPEPEFPVGRAEIGGGAFDFGVKAVNAEGAESPLHFSLETTAQPDSGWYLIWE
jgi:hypothetical protein